MDSTYIEAAVSIKDKLQGEGNPGSPRDFLQNHAEDPKLKVGDVCVWEQFTNKDDPPIYRQCTVMGTLSHRVGDYLTVKVKCLTNEGKPMTNIVIHVKKRPILQPIAEKIYHLDKNRNFF